MGSFIGPRKFEAELKELMGGVGKTTGQGTYVHKIQPGASHIFVGVVSVDKGFF